MTVVAWDGTTLAADKRGVVGCMPVTTTKIFNLGERGLLGYSGEQSFGEAMLYWYKQGASEDTFPAHQRDSADCASVIVVRKGRVIKYDRTPYPIEIHERQVAIGSGRDFALAAMYCGKSAVEAVEIACKFDVYCGNGVDALSAKPVSKLTDWVSADEKPIPLNVWVLAKNTDEIAMVWKDQIDELIYAAPQGGLIPFRPTHWMHLP